jgi:hypothetical protein
VSLTTPARQPLAAAGRLERAAVNLLAPVGGDVEWWLWTPRRVRHLRVAVTDDEHQRIPDGCAIHDAGETGPRRARRRPPRR